MNIYIYIFLIQNSSHMQSFKRTYESKKNHSNILIFCICIYIYIMHIVISRNSNDCLYIYIYQFCRKKSICALTSYFFPGSKYSARHLHTLLQGPT